MKRGIVMEVTKRKAVILRADGTFEKITLPQGEAPTVGQEFLFPDLDHKQTNIWSMQLFPKVALAAAMLLVIVLASQYLPMLSDANKVMAIISVDINPSIEVSINEDMEIVAIHLLNHDAGELLSDTKQYEKMEFKTFMLNLLAKAKEKGYLEKNHDLLIATTIVNNPSKNNFEHNLKAQVTNIPDTSNMSVTYINTEKKTHKEAKDKGLSLGRYIALVEANKQGKKLTVAEAKSKSVDELKDELKDKIAQQDNDKRDHELINDQGKEKEDKDKDKDKENNKDKDKNKGKDNDKDKEKNRDEKGEESRNEDDDDSEKEEKNPRVFNCTTLSNLLQLSEEQEEYFEDYCEEENEDEENNAVNWNYEDNKNSNKNKKDNDEDEDEDEDDEEDEENDEDDE